MIYLKEGMNLVNVIDLYLSHNWMVKGFNHISRCQESNLKCYSI